jgi:hypothetical protein
MTISQHLHASTKDTYSWSNKVISSLEPEKWNELPETLETTMSWQVGHLILSNYYHTVKVIVGNRPDILESIPMRDYNLAFGYGSKPNLALATTAAQLLRDLQVMQENSLSVISGLSDKELIEELVESKIPHPVAKTKGEAIDWNIKHNMWHVGQIATLVRVLGDRIKFR